MNGIFAHHTEAYLRETLNISIENDEKPMGIGEFYYRWGNGEFEGVIEDESDILKLRGKTADGTEYVTQKKLCRMTEPASEEYDRRIAPLLADIPVGTIDGLERSHERNKEKFCL